MVCRRPLAATLLVVALGSACSKGPAAPTGEPDGGSPTTDSDAAVAVLGPRLHTLAAGQGFSCAIVGDGRVKCWGSNNRGQLGIENREDHGRFGEGMGNALPFVMLGTGDKAVSLAAGYEHACALLSTGQVKCWGSNAYGQLGQGDLADRGWLPGQLGDNLKAIDLGAGRTAKGVFAGSTFTCALLDDSSLKCWGQNIYGALGLGSTENVGGKAGEMGDALPALKLGSGVALQDAAAAAFHTCALFVDGTAKCWGLNEQGQLATGDTVNRGGTSESMATLPFLNAGSGWVSAALSAGGNATCLVSTQGPLKCYGNGSSGQLGQGSVQDRGGSPGDVGDRLAPINLGSGAKVSTVAEGGDFTCALLENGSVKCFGGNGFGQLYMGDTQCRGCASGQMGDALKAINFGVSLPAVEVAAGSAHVCARFADRSIRCWGREPGIGVDDPGFDGDLGDEPVDVAAAMPVVDLGDSGPTTGPVLADCQFTRSGCQSVCSQLYKSCSNKCSQLGANLGAVYASQSDCDATSSPVESVSSCTLLLSDVAQYLRCCCE